MPTITRSNSKAFEVLDARLKDLDGWQSKAGWFASSVYSKGQPAAYIAAIHEFGVPSKNIPARPFMRPTVERDSGSWAVGLGRGAAAVVKGNATAKDVFEGVGRMVSDGIAKSITLVLTPALKEATVRARARRKASGKITETLRKPLVDTGYLLDQVNHTTQKGGED